MLVIDLKEFRKVVREDFRNFNPTIVCPWCKKQVFTKDCAWDYEDYHDDDWELVCRSCLGRD